MIDLEKKFWQWAVMLLLAFIWGSSFILMKKGLVIYTPQQVASIRIFISFLVLLPIALRHLSGLRKSELKYLVIVGLCGTGVPAFLFAIAQTNINSSLAGMLNSLVPFFTLLLGVLIFGLKFKLHRILGVMIGLLGAFGLLGLGTSEVNTTNWTYGLLIVAATICYAISVNVIKKYLVRLKSLAITATSIMFIGPPAGIFLFTTDFTDKASQGGEHLASLLAVLTLGIFGTALAIIIFNMLIKRVSALFAASVTYLIPVFAILWGVVDGEIITTIQLVSIAIILTGVYIVNKS